MKKMIFRLISCILVSVMLVMCMPTAAISQVIEAISAEQGNEEVPQANKNDYNNMLEVLPDADSDEDIYIIAEDTSKRGEFEKHYICSDGTFVAVTYPEAVHYRGENGEWTDIDNSLSLNPADGTYEAVNGDFKISFHNAVNNNAALMQQKTAETAGANTDVIRHVSSDKLIELQNGDQALSWTLKANKGATAVSGTSVADAAALSDGILSVNDAVKLTVKGEIKSVTAQETAFVRKNVNDDDAFTLSKLSNKVQYDSIFGEDEGISVRYTAYRNKIKEDIIISKPTDIDSFSMSVNNAGLTPQLNEDGSVDFLDDNGDMVYHVGAPYMTDAAYTSSCEVDVKLTVLDGKCIITYIPDGKWMSSPDREYPIILDPSVSSSEYGTNVHDTYVESGSMAYNGQSTELYIDRGRVAIISFDRLPKISSSMPIVNAKLVVNFMFGPFTDVTLYMEKLSTYTLTDNIRYYNYEEAEKSFVTTTFAFETNPKSVFYITSEMYNLYKNTSGTKFAIRTYDNSSFCYPIMSSESVEGKGPVLIVIYGYRLPNGLANGDIITLQNAYDGGYIVSDHYETWEGNNILTEDVNFTDVFNQFELVRNPDTGGYAFKAVFADGDGYLTVGEDYGDADDIANDIILSYDYIPEKQDWLIIGAEYGTFDIVLRADVNRHLTVMSYGYYDPYEGAWIEKYTDLEIAYTAPYASGGLDCQNVEQQRWIIYKEGDMIWSEEARGLLPSGIYYMNNAQSDGFATNNGYRKAKTVKGKAFALGNKIKWIITNVGVNEYTFQLYSLPGYFLRCDKSGGIKFTNPASNFGDEMIWKLYMSPENNAYYTICNKVTGEFLYVDGEDILTADVSNLTKAERSWRLFDVYGEYQMVGGYLNLGNMRLDIGETDRVKISGDEDSNYLIPGDFYFDIISGEEHSKYIPLYGKFMGLNQGTTAVRATYKLTGDVYDFSITVSDKPSHVTIREGKKYYASEEMNVVADHWLSDKPNVATASMGVLIGSKSGYTLISGYNDENELIALTEVRVMSEPDEMLAVLSTNEMYYLYYQGLTALRSLAIDICNADTSRDFFETKLRLINAIKQSSREEYAANIFMERVFSDFGFEIVRDRAQYIHGEYLYKGCRGYYNPETQFGITVELLNNIKNLIAMYGFRIAQTMYAENFTNNMTSAQADVEAARQKETWIVNQARTVQKNGNYHADDFTVTILKRGTKIYRVCESAESLHQGKWYTTKSCLESCGYDYTAVYKGLQMDRRAYENFYVAEYVVNSDIYVATGQALNNTDYGDGGFIQYFIISWEGTVDYNGVVIPLVNTSS